MATRTNDGPGAVPDSALRAVLLFLFVLFVPSVATAQTVSVEEAVKAVSRNYERFRAIKDLTLRWTLRYEHLSGHRKFGFDTVEARSLRKGEKLRLATIARMPNGVTLIREMAWDGRTGTTNERHAKSGDYTITAKPFRWLYQYNYYTNYLSYADGAGSLPSLADAYQRDDASGWLPGAITSSPNDYRVDERVDDEGVRCVVLGKPASNAFWFDPEKGFALRRRDAWDSENGLLRTRTVLRDFRLVDGVWLPASIVREEFGGPDDPRSSPDQVRARKTIQVTEVSTDAIADQEFVLAAPDGVTVHDSPRRTFFHRYRLGENPIIAAAETLRADGPSYSGTAVLVAVAASLAVVFLALLVLRTRSVQSSANSSPTERTKPNGLRSAFTLIELLVVISIVGVLTMLVTSAVQSARESARRAKCINNLKQIGIALQNYHSAMNVLPMGYATRLDANGVSEYGGNWGWGAMVLPQMEMAPLFNSINFSCNFERPESQTARRTRISTYLCPSSDDFGPVTIHHWPLTDDPYVDDLEPANYVASAGTRSLGHSPKTMDGTIFTRDSEGDGAMYRNSSVSLSAIRDGASSTFLCGERSRNLADAAWAGTMRLLSTGYICTKPGNMTQECVRSTILVMSHTGPENGGGVAIWVDRPNYPASGADGYWSRHSGGCNFLYCDGSARFVKDTIDPRTFHALGTRSGGDVVATE